MILAMLRQKSTKDVVLLEKVQREHIKLHAEMVGFLIIHGCQI
jgi:hypoxanthine-guanine phosphoribosyltransferase